MQNNLIWAYNQMAKKLSALQKKPKIGLWEITGCAQILEIERPEGGGIVIKCVVQPLTSFTKTAALSVIRTQCLCISFIFIILLYQNGELCMQTQCWR
jgi:hypothetical protein